MVQNKAKGKSANPPSQKLKQKPKPSSDNKWEKVKLKGNVIAEEGVGLEGLIGLEVLENYDAGLIGASQVSIA